jgi:hypothetical protein
MVSGTRIQQVGCRGLGGEEEGLEVIWWREEGKEGVEFLLESRRAARVGAKVSAA